MTPVKRVQGLLVVTLLLMVAIAPSNALSNVPSNAMGGGAGFPRTVIDGLGRRIHLPSRPERIFSATLATDNILLTLVEPERVIGVTRFAADPQGSYVVEKLRPHMVRVEALNAEQILAAQPDIVLIAAWSDPDAVKQLRDLGLVLYTFTHFSTVQDALDNIARVGEITGEEEKAQALVRQFEAERAAVQERVTGLPRPTVLSWNAWGSTTGRDTPMHDIIESAGGIDLAAEHGLQGWVDIDPEAIIAMNPEVIVTESGEAFVQRVLADPALQSVSAVKQGRVYHVDHTGALNHHFIEAIRALARLLHPEAFADSDAGVKR